MPDLKKIEAQINKKFGKNNKFERLIDKIDELIEELRKKDLTRNKKNAKRSTDYSKME